MTQQRYRPDIDGLRAIAVLAVIFFHAGYDWAGGGFVGVDVFFVISGFLITGKILEDLDRGTFSWAQFYTRRARRLMPALLFTLAVSFLLGFWLLAPADLETLGHTLVYTIIPISNLYFWKDTGYFASDAHLKPLLHTWSLAVEEQFYILWPALLVALRSVVHRIRIRTLLLALLGILSFAAATHFRHTAPDAVFFLTPFRIFEFVLGALCVGLVDLQPRRQVVSEILVLVGLGLILWATWWLTDAIPFPGPAALMPCLGAVLVIYAGQAPIAGTLLRNKLCVGIGLISYSVYLVHWPLIVFYEYWKWSPISRLEQAAFPLASLAAGYLMWRFVETPFRRPAAKTQTDSFPFWCTLVALQMLFLAANAWRYGGWPARFPSEFLMSTAELDAERARYWDDSRTLTTPATRDGQDQRHIVVLGNSHAIDLIYALRENGSDDILTMLSTSHECYNFGTPIRRGFAENCASLRHANLANAAWQTADLVLLHDDWARKDLNGLAAILTDIRQVTDAPMFVLGPKMKYQKSIPEIARNHMRLASLNAFARQFANREERLELNDSLHEMLDTEEFRQKSIFFVDLLRTQCGDRVDGCEIVSTTNSHLLYFDSNHLTRQGAIELGQRLRARYPDLF